MERELFGGESSVEEEDSSDESSDGEEEKKQAGQRVERSQEQAGNERSSSSDSEESNASGEGEVREAQTPPAGGEPPDSQLPSTQDLFGESGSSSSSSEDEHASDGASPVAPLASPLGSPMGSPPGQEGAESGQEGAESESPNDPPSGMEQGAGPGEGAGALLQNGEEDRTVEGIFGDAADISSESEDEGPPPEREPDSIPEDRELDHEEAEERVEEVPRINVEIPRCVAQLGSDLYFVKLPNFLSVETRPFDPGLYEDEVEEDEILDEEGRARLKLKVENTIRWRYSQDESGNEIRESNARIVRWSDSTMSLYLGSEIFDIYKQPLQGEFSHLFVRQGTGLQGQAVFRSKLTFRPHSTDSQTHRKMTLSIADRFSKTQRIRVLPAIGKDPESQRSERIKKEEEKLRAAIRRENQQRRVKERTAAKDRLTANYLEPDRYSDGEEEGESVSAIKSSLRSSFRSRLSQGGYGSEGEGSSGEEGAERLLRAKVEDPAHPRKHRMEESEATAGGPAQKKQKKGRKLMLSSDEESD